MNYAQAFVLSLACLVIFSTHEAFGAERCEENFRSKIEIQTSGLKLISARHSDDQCIVMLRNDYAKSILAISVSPSGNDNIKYTWYFLTEGHTLPSGTTRELSFSDTHFSDEQSNKLSIDRVLFEDGTGEGASFENLKEQLIGFKKKYQLMLPLIQKALISNDLDSLTVLNRLAKEVTALSSTDNEDEPLAYRREAVEWLLPYVEELQRKWQVEGYVNNRQELTRLADELEQVINSIPLDDTPPSTDESDADN